MYKNIILIVDDDKRIRELLEKYLLKNNYIVLSSPDTSNILNLLDKYIVDLIILDYMLPNESGIEFLQKIRKLGNNIPIIMLTALGDIENRIEGLSYGADDYIGKPFEPKELLLRMQNILNKVKKVNIDNNEIFGTFTFNKTKMELFDENELIKLTDAEIKILQVFLENKNKILSRETICSLCNDINERSVDVQITRLRKKIESNSKNPNFIKTIRNKGYIFSI